MTEERRLVTVLFADVVGSTAIGETLDPEDLRHLLTSYFATAREVIEEHGGTLEKFIGDAVMAIFGVPRAHDDDARRAVAAALSLRARLRSDPRLGERLPIRIGVNTGEVVAGVGGTADQLLVTGDAVNVAARLQQQAAPWSILCGERTVAAAAAAFTFGPVRELEARGRTHPVRASELIGATTPASPGTPFVGRDADMAQLKLLAQRAFSERRPWLVTILAPPGIGKTRLLTEFLARLAKSSGGATVAVAHCLPYGQRLAYWPLRDVLHAIVDLPDDPSSGDLVERVEQWLAAAGVADARRTAELLGATVGVESAEPPTGTDLFEAWRTLVEAAGRRRPLVLAFEDLHWASDSLLDLVDFAMQPRRDVPALLVSIARPELLDRRPGWGAGRRHTMLDLAPLDRAAVGTIVEHLLESDEPALVNSVVERADGNPFFAGEIVRSVVERTTGAAGTAGVAARLRVAQQLPDTVQATVQARLDLLEPRERRVIQTGAVFGRSFEVPGVAAVMEADPGEIAGIVDRLIDRDLVMPIEGAEIAPRHILIRDVAYQTLPRTERAAAHAAAARWLAGRAASPEQQPVELIAFHWREAALLLGAMDEPPANLDDIRAEAVRWLRHSADRALGAAASGDAVSQLQAAIELADRPSLAELYERLGDANLQGELSAEALRHALELADETQLAPDVRLRILGKLLMHVTRSQGGVARRPTAHEMDELRATGRALLSTASDEQAIARYLIADAFLPFWALPADPPPDTELARDEARRGLAIVERLDDPDLRSAALDALTALSDTWSEAHDHASERLGFEDRLHLTERIDSHAMVTWTACAIGRLDEAASVAAAGLARVHEGQVPTYALHVATWQLCALQLAGRWDELDLAADHAVTLWEATGRSPAAFAVRGLIAALEAARARGMSDRVDALAGVLRAIRDQVPQNRLIAATAAFIAPDVDALAALAQDPATALPEVRVLGRGDYVQRAMSVCSDHGVGLAIDPVRRILDAAERSASRLVEAEARRALGLGLHDAAELRRALAIFEAAGARPLVARVQLELGGATADSALIELGIAALRALGDAEQLGRAPTGIGSGA